MNENDIHKNDADPCHTTECDPLPTEASTKVLDGEPSNEEPFEIGTDVHQEIDDQDSEGDVTSDEADPSLDREIPADPDPYTDPDHSASAQADPEEQLRRLRDELKQLRAEMAQQDALLSKMGAECEEFHTLYPQTPISSLPDNVWADVKRGIPLAAAYALAERRRAYTEALADSANKKNGQCSTGALASTENEYFSPSEVRAMSQAEVRANYQKIMRSMQKWN